MSHLFAAILLLSSPGCPHEEPSCITPTEYIDVDLSLTGRVLHDTAAGDAFGDPGRLKTAAHSQVVVLLP